jgi:hypothetical protein
VGEVLSQYEKEPDPMVPRNKSQYRRMKAQGVDVGPLPDRLKTTNLIK